VFWILTLQHIFLRIKNKTYDESPFSILCSPMNGGTQSLELNSLIFM
jgi:hypothetical protein